MNPVDISLHETWASAVTRQVLRGEAPRSRVMDFQTQRTTWVTFWAKVDAA